MVIIKFGEKRVVEKKSFFRIKKIYEDYFTRFNETVNGKIFTVIDTSFDITNGEILKLVKSNRGLIFKTNNNAFNDAFKDYLFDIKPYIKRAYYSSLKTLLEKESNNRSNVFIEDKSFSLCDEAYDLASVCKKMTVIGLENNYTNEFKNKCFNNYGLNVIFNEYKDSRFMNYIIRFPEDISEEYITISINEKEEKLYPDSKYFNLKSDFNRLLSYNLSIKELCAAVNEI